MAPQYEHHSVNMARAEARLREECCGSCVSARALRPRVRMEYGQAETLSALDEQAFIGSQRFFHDLAGVREEWFQSGDIGRRDSETVAVGKPSNA